MLLGIDVSLWQDANSTPQMMNFDKAKLAGANFVFIKTSESTFLDPDYILNWASAKKAGLPRGGYHYLTWSKPVYEQARFFAGVLKSDPGELPPVVDFECSRDVPADKKVSTARLKSFIEEFMSLTNVTPIIYTGPNYWKLHGMNDPYFLKFPLWIANYYTSKPLIPLPWLDWDFWQFTDKGDGLKFGAESKQLDMNWCKNPEKFKIKSQPVVTLEQRIVNLEAEIASIKQKLKEKGILD